MTNRIVRCTSALAFVLLRVSAQAPAAPSFEVASIRPHVTAAAQPGNGKKMIADGMRMDFAGSTARVTGATLGSLITFAYDLKSYEMGEGNWPAWKAEQFDILAKAEGDGALSREQSRPLSQALLTERFKLKLQRETKQMSGYMLTLAKNGPKVKTSDPETKASMSMTSTNYTAMTVDGWTMEQLARQFSAQLEEPVFDGTGLADRYDFKLTWSDTNGAYATFFTALQEQLGLKLERRKEPIQIFVVDTLQGLPWTKKQPIQSTSLLDRSTTGRLIVCGHL